MTQQEKEYFINQLIDNVKKRIIHKSLLFPEDWDGIELRWIVRDHFDLVVFGGYRDRRVKRFKDYENEVLVNNLV